MKVALGILAVLLMVASVSAEDLPLQQLGVPFHPHRVEIIWKTSLDKLPSVATVYRVIPTQYSSTAISNAMGLAASQRLKRARPPEAFRGEGGVLYFEDAETGSHLGIVPGRGYIFYGNSQAIPLPRQPIECVPSEQEALKLAEEIGARFGMDRSQLRKKPGSDVLWYTRAIRERGAFDKSQGKLVKTVVARQLFLVRTLNGIPSIGMGLGGGAWFSFGNDGQLAELELAWRNVDPKGTYPVAKEKQFSEWLQTGRCVCAFDWPEQIRAVTITNATPYYLELPGTSPQKEIHPIAELEAEAQLLSTNVMLRLYCPLVTREE